MFMFLTAYCWNSCIIVKKLAIAGVAIMILDFGEAWSFLKSLRYISFAFWFKSIVNCFVSDKSFWSVNNTFLDALMILLSTRSFETLSFLSVFIGGGSMVGWSSLFYIIEKKIFNSKINILINFIILYTNLRVANTPDTRFFLFKCWSSFM